MIEKPKVQFRYLSGMSYKECWDFQKSLQQKLIRNKIKVTKTTDTSPVARLPNQLIFCEHAPVYTLGKSGSIDNLLISNEKLQKEEIEFFKINRGGDITYHGPGQITGYLIFDLDYFYHDVHRFVRDIEEAIIRFLQKYNVTGTRVSDYTGVWIRDKKSNEERKICAIGVHMSRWVSLHGFGFNINTDLSYFNKIIPCGIVQKNKKVTSLSNELKTEIKINEVIEALKYELQSVFNFDYLD